MTNSNASKGINIFLWIVQSLLAVMFLMAGAGKLFQPITELEKMLPWVTSVSPGLVRFIGLSELLGGIGVLLPSILRIKTGLTSYAALGLAAVMLLAAVFHISRGEYPAIGMPVLLMALALFAAWGRTKKAPVLSK